MPVLDNPKHERFAQELAKGSSATEAYVAAGYKPQRQNAARLMSNDVVKARVTEIQERVSLRTEITKERVLRELAKLGFSDVRKVVKWSGAELADEVDGPDGLGGEPQLVIRAANLVRLIGSDEVDDETAAAIAEVSQTKEGSLKVKMHSKLDALDKISKMLGYYAPEKHELTGPDGGPIQSTTVITDDPVEAAKAYQRLMSGG